MCKLKDKWYKLCALPVHYFDPHSLTILRIELTTPVPILKTHAQTSDRECSFSLLDSRKTVPFGLPNAIFPHCLTAHAPETWHLCFWHKITNSFSSSFRSCISDSSLPVLMLTNISYFCTCCSALLGCSSDSKMYPTAEAVRPIFRSRQLWKSWRSVLAAAPFFPTHFGFYVRKINLLHLSSPVLEWSMVLHRN